MHILCHFLTFSCISFHVLSFPFIFFHFLFFFFFLVLLFFSGAQNPPFFASIASRLPIKALMKKIVWAVYSIGPSLFSRLFFIFSSSFSLSISFHVFLFFIFYSFNSLLFSFKKCFFLFHFVSLFSFLGCSKSLAALQDSLE